MTEPAAVRDLSPAELSWRQFRKHRVAMASVAVFVAIALACLAAPVLAPYGPDAIDMANLRQAPSVSHWMGTDDLGRDVLSRLLFGGRVSILIGVLAAILGTGLGTLIGAVAGFYGRWADNVLMRVTDVAYAIPTLPLLIVLSAYSNAAAFSMILIIGLLSWMTTARVVRAQVLSIKETEYVLAARSIGVSHAGIIARHVVPNAMGPIIVGATLAVGNAIMVESSLSFLGLGIQPPTATWGNMLMDSQATMASRPWLTIFPGLAILLVVLAINFIGDGLHDALDPTVRAA
jgi:peptide/nickel transport system permease protein